MNSIDYNFDFGEMHKYLMRYYKSKDTRDFNMFVSHGAGRFILLIIKSKFRGIKKEAVKDLEQVAAHMTLLRLMNPREALITDMKNYLYTVAITACYDIIRKYELYENEKPISSQDKGDEIESPQYIPNSSEMINVRYEKLLHYLTQQMAPEPMKPYQAYVFIEFIKGYNCIEIAQHMPDRKFEAIKSDLGAARKVLKLNRVSKAQILEVLEIIET